MKTITYKLKDLEEKKEKKVTLKLGYVGENEHVQIRIDCSEIWENYPNAVASLAVEPPEGEKYPAIVTRDGDMVCWTVKDSDLVHDGYGRIQLTFTEGSEIQKTVICRTKVDESIVGSGTAPDPIADFVAEANEALAELEAAEVHGPVIGEDGYWYTWSKDAGEYVKTDTKAQGEDGQQGPAGKDGADGAPGQDGHTPVKGTDYWTQQDQADIVAAAALETVSAVIDDTAGDGDTNKTWSADKISETTGQLLTAIHGLDNFETITNNDITQLKKDGFTTLYPDWETGDWGANGKTSDNGKRRSKTLLHVPKGTYTVNSSIVCAVWGYATEEATRGCPLLWNQTGEKTFEVTNREYIAFVVSWANEGNPITEMYAVVPSALSEVIVQANKTEILAQANKALLANRTEYSDGIYHAITNGTLTTDKDIGNGIPVGSAVTFNNDSYFNVLEIAVTEGKTYRMKARVYNDYYLFHFTDANDILIEKGGKNTTGATATLIDVVATAPTGATKAYLCGMKNTTILCDVFEPYTIKQIQDMEHKPTRGAYCIMEFNVGDWYEGRYRSDDKTGIIPADETIYANYMSLFNGIFGRYKPDIAMLNEDARYMCLNTHDDDRAFVGQYFRNQYSGLFQSQDKTDVFNTLASAFHMFDLSTRYFTDTESNMRRNYVKGYTYLNGRKVCIISAHLSSDWDTAKLNAAELLTDLQTEDPEYLICCGDFNLLPSVAEIVAFETAGYTVSNGNVTYDGHTYGPGDFIITTSNITVKSVFCDTQKIDASFVEYIDHLPTIAYLEIY